MLDLRRRDHGRANVAVAIHSTASVVLATSALKLRHYRPTGTPPTGVVANPLETPDRHGTTTSPRSGSGVPRPQHSCASSTSVGFCCLCRDRAGSRGRDLRVLVRRAPPQAGVGRRGEAAQDAEAADSRSWWSASSICPAGGITQHRPAGPATSAIRTTLSSSSFRGGADGRMRATDLPSERPPTGLVAGRALTSARRVATRLGRLWGEGQLPRTRPPPNAEQLTLFAG